MKQSSKKGFTLIELVVVMAIIAVLAALVVGAIIAARSTALETANRTNGKTLQTGFEAVYASTRAYGSSGTAATVSFQAAAAAGIANVSGSGLTTGTINCAGKLIGTQAVDGGGYVTYSKNGYLIVPAKSSCTAAQDVDNQYGVGTP
jgi:prepilin-type N-terminal cleavage/methylation domain-containing protein